MTADREVTERAAREPPATFLPPEAAHALQRACLNPVDSLRRIAIDQVTEQMRAKYPEFFRKED